MRRSRQEFNQDSIILLVMPEHLPQTGWIKTEVHSSKPWKDKLSELNPDPILSKSWIYHLPFVTYIKHNILLNTCICLEWIILNHTHLDVLLENLQHCSSPLNKCHDWFEKSLDIQMERRKVSWISATFSGFIIHLIYHYHTIWYIVLQITWYIHFL